MIDLRQEKGLGKKTARSLAVKEAECQPRDGREGTRGRAAIKAIAVMGLLAFVMLWAGSIALRRSVTPDEDERVGQRSAQSPVEGQRALGLVETLCTARGERLEVIAKSLRGSGFRAERIETGAEGNKRTHLIARRAGARPGHVVLMTPYAPASADLPGANSASAGVALLVELARVLPRDWSQHTVWLVFLDGVNQDDQSHGARVANELLQAPEAGGVWMQQPTAVVYIAGVGDCYLNIARDRNAPQALVDVFFDTAKRFMLGAHFGGPAHVAGPVEVLHERNIPAIALADLVYGGSLLEHDRLWHTVEDTPSRVCDESLQAVGDVLYHSIPAMDGYLNGVQGL